MSDSFAKDLHFGKSEKPKKFHFRKVWYEGFINPKYTVTAENMDPVHMVRDEEGNWILENKANATAEARQQEKEFAKVIDENQ